MNKKNVCFMFMFLLLFSIQVFSQRAQRVDYKIGSQDKLIINVVDFEEISDYAVQVSEEGKISLPYLGEIEVEGLTKTEVEKKLVNLLREKKYILNPQISVYIEKYSSKFVHLLGAVKIPGEYPLVGKMKLLQILSQAGGLTSERGDRIIIIREMSDGTSSKLEIPLEKLLHGDTNLNIPLEPGDIINIPVNEIVYIYILGKVNKECALEVKKYNIPTLTQAIAMAGGFSPGAKKRGVLIKWTDEEGKEQIRKVNVKKILSNKIKDVQLKENDIIIIPETWLFIE